MDKIEIQNWLFAIHRCKSKRGRLQMLTGKRKDLEESIKKWKLKKRRTVMVNDIIAGLEKSHAHCSKLYQDVKNDIGIPKPDYDFLRPWNAWEQKTKVQIESTNADILEIRPKDKRSSAFILYGRAKGVAMFKTNASIDKNQNVSGVQITICPIKDIHRTVREYSDELYPCTYHEININKS